MSTPLAATAATLAGSGTLVTLTLSTPTSHCWKIAKNDGFNHQNSTLSACVTILFHVTPGRKCSESPAYPPVHPAGNASVDALGTGKSYDTQPCPTCGTVGPTKEAESSSSGSS